MPNSSVAVTTSPLGPREQVGGLASLTRPANVIVGPARRFRRR
jgi:hypothetical protein